jgi:hypothetical protein
MCHIGLRNIFDFVLAVPADGVYQVIDVVAHVWESIVR